MISVVMPYWNRRALLSATLAGYAKHYAHFRDFEVVVVDDGSPEPPEIGPMPWPVSVIRLPSKNAAANPCVPINRGVRASDGDVIVLTNPECSHSAPIFDDMLTQLEQIGPFGYVCAAAWSVDTSRFYCSTYQRSPGSAPIPVGSGFHFCAMLRRSLYDAAGGFDEAYREGQAFEDNDWLWRLEAVGADFKILDRCVVSHHATRTKWPPGGHERNRRLFEQRWPSHALSS